METRPTTASHSRKFLLAVIAALLGMLAIMTAPADTGSSWLSGRMLSLHLVLELFAVIIAALVVTASWHTFDRREDRSANAFIAGFLIVGACDLMHALTFQGMPGLLTESSTPGAIFFWLMGRSFEVLTLGAIALALVPRFSRSASLLIGILVSVAIIGFGSYAIEHFPVTFVEGVGVTPFKARYEFVLMALNFLVALLLWRRKDPESARQNALLALSAFFMGVGGLAFTAYVAPTDFQNIGGHLYKVMAYVLLYRATYITNILAPYEALQASEARVRESQTRMHTLGANLAQSVLYQVVRELDGSMRFTQMTDAVERIIGLKATDVLREPAIWYRQFHPEDLPLLQIAVQRSADTMLHFDFEARLTRADGRLRRMHFVSTPRRLDDGRLVWDGIMTDITERSEAQEVRRKLELQLREAQKMESIGTLASGIAHDFNNVLAAILGNTMMVIEDVERGAREEALLGLAQIRKAGSRARSLVNQILSFSRREEPERVAQPLQPILAESVSLLRSTLPASIELVEHMDDPNACALVDRTQLEQVIVNLCTNAWHALGDTGGRINVGISEVSIGSDQALVRALIPGRYVRLRVEDNGCGMDEATRQRVFEPFFTTKAVGKGTGIGLSVVHRIAVEHDGAITVESSPGRGARFDVFIPALPVAVDAENEPSLPARGARDIGRGERVLYVEDDAVISLMVERMLRRAGYTVSCQGEPEKAIETLRRAPHTFDIVVTDYNMPVHSGLDVIRQVASIRPGLPTILISGYVSDELQAKAEELGVFDILEKQRALDELAPAIKKALMRANMTAEA